jgi:triosephosphate isomerase
MRKRIVAGNWKMNNTLEEGLKLSSEVVNMVNDEVTADITVVMGAPFIHLSSVSQIVKDSDKVFLSAQNCNEHAAGAYTGEISVAMLTSVGATHVILGHSERREYFKETNTQLAAKVDAVLAAGLTPIFCCGESLEIREADEQYKFVFGQLSESLFHLDAEAFAKVVIAYEPIWAIGTGKTASAQQAQEMHAEIRQHLASQYGDSVASEISILYGGSCNPGNAVELFANPDVDGGLIGGASLKSRDFLDIIKSFA